MASCDGKRTTRKRTFAEEGKYPTSCVVMLPLDKRVKKQRINIVWCQLFVYRLDFQKSPSSCSFYEIIDPVFHLFEFHLKSEFVSGLHVCNK